MASAVRAAELVLNARLRADRSAVPFAGLLPDPARLEYRDDLLLVAAGVTAHQDFVVLGILDGQAWLAILVGGAPCHPRGADLATTEGPGDGFSGHGRRARQGFHR